MRAGEDEVDFEALVAADPEIVKRLGPEGVAQAFDLAAVLQHVDVLFERLAALTAKGEPVHA